VAAPGVYLLCYTSDSANTRLSGAGQAAARNAGDDAGSHRFFYCSGTSVYNAGTGATTFTPCGTRTPYLAGDRAWYVVLK
jgi:hypothetical protein